MSERTRRLYRQRLAEEEESKKEGPERAHIQETLEAKQKAETAWEAFCKDCKDYYATRNEPLETPQEIYEALSKNMAVALSFIRNVDQFKALENFPALLEEAQTFLILNLPNDHEDSAIFIKYGENCKSLPNYKDLLEAAEEGLIKNLSGEEHLRNARRFFTQVPSPNLKQNIRRYSELLDICINLLNHEDWIAFFYKNPETIIQPGNYRVETDSDRKGEKEKISFTLGDFYRAYPIKEFMDRVEGGIHSYGMHNFARNLETPLGQEFGYRVVDENGTPIENITDEEGNPIEYPYMATVDNSGYFVKRNNEVVDPYWLEEIRESGKSIPTPTPPANEYRKFRAEKREKLKARQQAERELRDFCQRYARHGTVIDEMVKIPDVAWDFIKKKEAFKALENFDELFNTANKSLLDNIEQTKKLVFSAKLNYI